MIMLFPIIAIALWGGFLISYAYQLDQMKKLYEELHRKAFLDSIDIILNSNVFCYRMLHKSNAQDKK